MSSSDATTGQRRARMRGPSAVEILLRSGAALPGAYAASYAVTGAAALWLPMVRAEAVILADSLSFLLLAGLAVAAFATRTAARAWAIMAVLAAIGAAAWWAAA